MQINIFNLAIVLLIITLITALISLIPKARFIKSILPVPVIAVCIVSIVLLITNGSYNQEVFTEYYELVKVDGSYITSTPAVIGQNEYVHYLKDNVMKSQLLSSTNHSITTYADVPQIQVVTTRYKWLVFYTDKSVYNISIPQE